MSLNESRARSAPQIPSKYLPTTFVCMQGLSGAVGPFELQHHDGPGPFTEHVASQCSLGPDDGLVGSSESRGDFRSPNPGLDHACIVGSAFIFSPLRQRTFTKQWLCCKLKGSA